MNHISVDSSTHEHPCAYCSSALKAGEPAWRCDQCAAVHHIDCWVEGEGCAVYGCANGRSARSEIIDPKKSAKAESNVAPTPPTTSHQPSPSSKGRNIWIAVAALVCLLAGVTAVGLLTSGGDGASDNPPANAEPASTADTESDTNGSDLHLTAEEHGFSSRFLSARPGTIKVTVSVPEDADVPHGVGIDGGEYDDIEGARVGPGRETSLTVAVSRGEYTIYDPANGHKATLVVE